MTQHPRPCALCGGLFHPKRPHGTYCCRAHRQRAYELRRDAALREWFQTIAAEAVAARHETLHRV